jgi:diacylglycerol O-acyltransferase / wax synthase
MRRLSFLDLVFFITESQASPKHVGGLSIFSKPQGAGKNWVKDFYREWLSREEIAPPFNYIIDFKALGGPCWREAETAAIDEHVFYHSSKRVLSEEALYAMTASLHEPLMDRSKPLWEFHLIDNLAGNRFALYTKIHHAMADGVTLTRWLNHSLSKNPKAQAPTAVWQQTDTGVRRRKKRRENLFKSLARSGNQWRQVLVGISKLVTQLALEGVGLTTNAVSIPFKSREESPLTGEITPERQFASASIDMASLDKLRKATRCTLNHIALTCIDGALRNYLRDHGLELDRPISIQMPVNLRDKNDQVSGNKIGIVLVDLAPPTDDPYARLREIGFTLRAVRNQIDSVPAVAVSQYTAVLAVLLELIDILKLNRRLPAVADTLVSNVPGPKDFMYMHGARLEQSLPASTLAPGSQLNITLYSYAGTLYFGLMATSKVEDLSSLSAYIEEAFAELENAVYKSRK